VLQVLVDADNVPPVRVAALISLLPDTDVRLVAVGRPTAIARVEWPSYAEVVVAAGWQRADIALTLAYDVAAGDDPLVIVSGDGDFALLAGRHAGPVLVVSEAASSRLRDVATVVDPVVDGLDPLRHWLAAVT
jgi:hypothetical protein